MEGFGRDLDLAVRFGAPIADCHEVDHLDVSEARNPTYTFTPPAVGVLYVDVFNLFRERAAYRLTVIAADGTPGRYVGELSLGGQRYAFEARGDGGRLDGTFASGGSTFPFHATLAGSTLTVVSGGGTYATVRVGPASAADNPLGAGSAAATDDPVLVRGTY